MNGKHNNKHPNGSGGTPSASRSSGKQLSEEENRIIERVKREGFSGNLLLHEVGRRLGQYFQQRSSTRNQQSQGVRQGPTYDAQRVAHLTEASGTLARQIFKSFPFHVGSTPPVDFEANGGGDPRFLPVDHSTRGTITVSAGTTCLIFPGFANSAFEYCSFGNADATSTFFNKTASATWPFDGATNIPVQPLYLLESPPNVRAAFGVWNSIDWPSSAVDIRGGATDYSQGMLLGGGCAFEISVPYTGTAQVHWLAPSDHPTEYGPRRPHDNAAVNKTLNLNQAIDSNNNWYTLATALPATGLDDLHEQLPHSITRYLPPPSLDMVDDFSPSRVYALCNQKTMLGGNNASTQTISWTYHTEQERAYLDRTLPSGSVYNPLSFENKGVNPTRFLQDGQGVIFVTATTADVTVVARARCHFAYSLVGAAVAQHVNRPEVELFNDDTRRDADEHTDSPSAHTSAVGATVEEALAGAGIATLASQLKNSAVAKQIGSKVASTPIVGSIGRAIVSKAESGAGWLFSHLGSMAKSVLPKVATAAEDAAEVAFLL